jgi:hypothetical protein
MSETSPATPSTLGPRGRLIATAIAVGVVAAWIGAAATFGLTSETRPRAIGLGFALLATEAAFWAFALMLGLKVAQARGLIWTWLKGVFRRR